MAEKDFGPIENDYAFFMAHATEAASDVPRTRRPWPDLPPGERRFGCSISAAAPASSPSSCSRPSTGRPRCSSSRSWNRCRIN